MRATTIWGLKRFLEEARVLARLSHPRVVRVHRVIEAGGTAYMVMEYVKGRSLGEELESAGRLGEERVRAIVEGLADGLEAVHAAGLLHRDLKPDNVMLDAHGGSPVLIDFGAARAVCVDLGGCGRERAGPLWRNASARSREV